MGSFHVLDTAHTQVKASACIREKQKIKDHSFVRGESSLMAQWEVRFPAIISATFHRCIKLKTRYNLLLVQVQD